MIEREKEIYSYYHGYCAALQDILQHWDENTPIKEIIDYHLREALKDLVTEHKKIWEKEE